MLRPDIQETQLWLHIPFWFPPQLKSACPSG
jgi:hypothetical protein